MEHTPLTAETDSEALAKLKARAAEQAAKLPEKLKRAAAPEAGRLHGKKHTPEQLGHMAVGVEADERRSNSKHADGERLKLDHEAVKDRRIEVMNRAELLALSEMIMIDSTTLRQIYETHLIGERGLRRLVEEHLSGGDVKKILRQEIIDRETDFERDPRLRDQGHHIVNASSGVALDDLVKKAASGLSTNEEETAFFKAKAQYEVDQRQIQFARRRWVDVALIGTIFVLVILVISLYLSRH